MRRKENLTFQPPPSGLFSMLHTRHATGRERSRFQRLPTTIFQWGSSVSNQNVGIFHEDRLLPQSYFGKIGVGLQSFCGLDWRLPTGSAGRIVNAAPAPAVLPKSKLPNYKSSRTENL